jgi:hypothetical protein
MCRDVGEPVRRQCEGYVVELNAQKVANIFKDEIRSVRRLWHAVCICNHQFINNMARCRTRSASADQDPFSSLRIESLLDPGRAPAKGSYFFFAAVRTMLAMEPRDAERVEKLSPRLSLFCCWMSNN